MMANDLPIVFDHFNQVFLTSERKYLPAANPFESYDNEKNSKTTSSSSACSMK